MARRNREETVYTVISLGGRGLEGLLEECLVVNCSNMMVLERLTGIKRDRLAYIFSRKKKSFLMENDFIILKSSLFYRGEQRGNGKNLLRGFGMSRQDR